VALHHPLTSTRQALAALVDTIRNAEEGDVEREVLRLSSTRRWLAPLAFVVSAFTMLFTGLKLLVGNWRLTLVQIPPAIWIWVLMFDLKAHVLHGREFTQMSGWLLAVVIVAVVAVTVVCFRLNALFAFAVIQPGRPDLRVARQRVREHRRTVQAWGFGMGLLIAFAAFVADRIGPYWFAVTMSIAIGILMIAYLAVPSRMIGLHAETRSRRDKIAASLVSSSVSAIVCTPPYLLARLGLLMLGSSVLRIPGILFLAIGLMLQAGATGSVKAVKMSATLMAARDSEGRDSEGGDNEVDETESPTRP
jgi:hypothetical protein